MTTVTLTPRLVVDDARAAIAFYTTALNAVERLRVTDSGGDDGKIVHAEMELDDHVFFLTESDGVHNRSPRELDGSPLLLTLSLADVDRSGARFVEAGGDVVIPIDDRWYGRREGRLRDPFGHLWIFSRAEDS